MASKCLSQRHAFSSAKIQNKNVVCKFFLKIGTTRLFFNTFREVVFQKNRQNEQNERMVGVGWSVGLGVRVSVEPTPNPAHFLCLSMFQMVG